MNKKTIIAVILALLIIGFVAYRLFYKGINTPKNNASNSSAGGNSGSTTNEQWPLLPGNRQPDERVRQIQRGLNKRMPLVYVPLVVDGLWGDRTSARLVDMNLGDFAKGVNKNEFDILIMSLS
jgi:hypothetical protein